MKEKTTQTQWWIDNSQKWYENEMLQVAPGDIFHAIAEIKSLKPKSILDLGCGSGRWSVLMPEYSYYLGIDVSPVLIDIAKKNHPDSDFKVLNATQLTKLKKKFDLIFSYGTLLGIPEEEMKKVAKAMKKVGKYAVFIERTGWEPYNPNQIINSARYTHDYRKYFNVIKEIPMQTNRSLFLVKL